MWLNLEHKMFTVVSRFNRSTQIFKTSNRRNVHSETSRNHNNYLKYGLIIAGAAACTYFIYKSKTSSKEVPKNASLSPEEFRDFQLAEKIKVSSNTSIYRFLLTNKDEIFDLPVASFLLAQANVKGQDKPVIRPYTPISFGERGHFDLMVKSYPEGILSKHIGTLKVGDKLQFQGPIKKITYTENMKKEIGMIAGGSGITPMYQIIKKILSNPNDKTKVILLFGNVTEDDILLRQELDNLQSKHPNFKVHYTLDNPSANWKQFKGFVTEDMVKSVLPPPSDNNLILVCGPPGLMKSVSGTLTEKYEQGELTGVLKRIGYKESQVYKF